MLVIMSSLYMHQLVRSMVNWNIYNDNTMTCNVSYLKNSRSSQGRHDDDDVSFKTVNSNCKSMIVGGNTLMNRSVLSEEDDEEYSFPSHSQFSFSPRPHIYGFLWLLTEPCLFLCHTFWKRCLLHA